MVAKILKVEQKKSKYGDFFHYVFFKEEETGKSFRTCIYQNMGNARHWDGLMEPGNVLGGLRTINRNGSRIVDADCIPQLIRKESLADPRD